MPHVAASYEGCGQAESGQGAGDRDNGLAQAHAEVAVARLLPLKNRLTLSYPFSAEVSKGREPADRKSVTMSITSGCSVGFNIITALSR